ncbi:hypothetical protein H181DRAFT_02294 [Streptomyces sp. WMMB 714]|jgi:hypothetical protein|uniref:hypothetical protein n=1 Tax=Streptomyces sp. WMMB 714 TaxID=1286822 RepID=UPI0005F78A68|nr:hypothetical protein [Streptomyces sp. WMMB 714]SCK29240.1 hypothetical protein H181DRAFT_02294 [Streptomyces sp. WMMB 714]
MRQGTTGKARTKTALALAPALAVMALTATACGGSGQTVSSEAPKKQSRFEKRATQIEQDWPKVKRTKERHNDMLPLQAAQRPVQGKEDSLTVTVGHGGCDSSYGAHVQETDKLVIVAGWAKEKKDADFCTKQLVSDKTKVKLESELGDRTVVDAATGKELLKG